ncbi:MAG: hypothetical protein CMJ64_30185 [Planctomycetaceae bacterium]|nr:hypothetical protein [Planctomycetaceae bacterium]
MYERILLCLLTCLACTPLAEAAEPTLGYQANVQVTGPTRIDWVFTVANQSPVKPPADWLRDYDSAAQTYELFVPRSYRAGQGAALMLFISPGDRGAGYDQWKQVCTRHGLLFASPHNAGNRCPTEQRVRIVLDVLDDIRRSYDIDPDRTYIGGFSGGGRIACSIGFALPEYFGGVVPVCAGGDLRDESWLRHRVIDRLSVAHLTGESDFNRGEVERLRGPLLKNVGVRSRVWVAPKLGHGIPSAKSLDEAFLWLEEARGERVAVAMRFPASRASRSEGLTREGQAASLLAEAKRRVESKETRYSGLMQMKGILTRWPNLAAAREARSILLSYEQGDDRSWAAEDIVEQRRFLIARARAIDAYASGPLPRQYDRQRADMVKAAINLWKTVLNDGQDADAVAEARKRLPELEKILDGQP